MQQQLATEQWIKDPFTLAMSTFWLMHGWLDDIADSFYDKNSGNGTAAGTLNQNIGPVAAGTSVNLSNNGNKINIEQFNEHTDDLDIIFSFTIIISEPIIIENKRKM